MGMLSLMLKRMRAANNHFGVAFTYDSMKCSSAACPKGTNRGSPGHQVTMRRSPGHQVIPEFVASGNVR
ncbi:hypothetical protein N7461_000238 [Penicillium sp. DV-2018c]|nr:hypothetical protein N7461_000238 [Penicillium sp. DV-2018c]